VEEVGADRITEALPGARLDGIAAAFFEPRSGYADPLAATLRYVEGARRFGAEVREGVACLRLVRRNRRVVGVETSDGEIVAATVILAAGPWSGVIAAASGLTLPMHCTREQELLVTVDEAAAPRCSISSVVDRFYARPVPTQLGNGATVLIGRGFPKPYEVVEPEGYDGTLHDDFESELRERVSERVPALGAAPKVGGHAGLYAVTPDWHPLLGPMPNTPGLVLATGGSGHCFKLAPALGEMMAASIVGAPVEYASTDDFSIERFDRGTTFGSTYGGNRA
jgi:sarcosine oxidase, subunit beta